MRLSAGGYYPGMPPDPDAQRKDESEGRMSIGEHLEELRGRVIRGLLAFVVVCIPCIWLARYLLALIARPVVLALRRHGQPDNFLQTSPVEAVLIYIKVVVIAGFVIAGPYILYQLWSFVAVGLYPHERKWVRRMIAPSIGLFLLGVAFMYSVVLLVSLNFLVGFGSWMRLPEVNPTAVERVLLGEREVTPPGSQPGIEASPTVPLLLADPQEPPAGHVWFNLRQNKLKLRGSDGNTYSLQLQQDTQRALVTTHFKIGQYLTFVLTMTIAFGVAFQMPLAVLFLVRSGIVPIATLRKYRKIVILIIVFTAGILAPPDVLSHLLLSGPMILLFEIGLLLARRSERRAASDSA